MSRAQVPHWSFLKSGNPFHMLSPKGSPRSKKLVSLLDNFEETLAVTLRKLKPDKKEDVLRLSWIRLAMISLSNIHSDVINLMMDLEIPVSDWDEKWIEVYLNNSVKLLDICNAFTSEISHLKQAHLLLKCASHCLDGDSQKKLRACSYLDSWRLQLSEKNPQLDNCSTILDGLVQILDQPKVKNSAKGKVLMRALYGVKVFTVSVCSIVTAAFSGSSKKLLQIQVSGTYLWAEAFADLQAFLSTEICRSLSAGNPTVVKELEAVDADIKMISPILKGETDTVKGKALQVLASDLSKSSENLTQELYLLSEEVDRFFRVVLAGRDALLSHLRD